MTHLSEEVRKHRIETVSVRHPWASYQIPMVFVVIDSPYF